MIFSIALITLFAFVMGAPAEFKGWPFRQGVARAEFRGWRIPQKPFVPFWKRPAVLPALMNLRMPQGHPGLDSPWIPNWQTRASASAGAEVPPVTIKAEAAGTLNVFGERLQGCENEDDLCSYTPESPRLCVRTGKFEMRFGCKSIWEANWKPMIDALGRVTGSQKPTPGDTAKCEGVPAEVLDSQYSKDQFNAGFDSKEYKLDGYKFGTTGNIDFQGDKVPVSSKKTKRFRDSIDFICQTCALYATSESAKNTLQSKCEAVGLNAETSRVEQSRRASEAAAKAREDAKEAQEAKFAASVPVTPNERSTYRRRRSTP